MSNVARGNNKDSVKTFHECTKHTVTSGCSPDVFVNSIGAVRFGDACQTHTVPGGEEGGECVPHTPTLTSASSKVFVNGRGIGRAGDAYSGERIISGSDNVFAG